MLKLFRRIRQVILTDNKPSSPVGRYLLYAIGEIILVVIGILIALGINNANERKKDQAKEKIYLLSLYQEIEQDSIFFEKTERMLEKIETSARSVVKVLEDPKHAIEDSLAFLTDIRYMIGLDQKLPEPIVWEELKSTGNLRLIKDRTLIEQLYKYYRNVKGCQKDFDDNAFPFILKGRYFDSKTFSLDDQDDYFDNWKKDTVSSSEVFQKLVESKDFLDIAKGIATGMMISRKGLLKLRKNVHETLKVLRETLSKE